MATASEVYGQELKIVNLFSSISGKFESVQTSEGLERGLWINEQNGSVAVFTMINGECNEVLSSNNRNELASKIEQLRQSRLQHLQLTYGVKISREGQAHHVQGEARLARTPLLAEILSLEFALEHSRPAHIQRNYKKVLTVCFLANHDCLPCLAEWTLDDRASPIICVGAAAADSHWYSLESTIMHELSHQSQYETGLDLKNFGSWRCANELGWHSFHNPATGESGWAMRTKDHKLFKYGERINKWVRCNRQGQPLSREGKRVKRQLDAELASSDEISANACVRPATSYFVNPAEVMAEGMMLFRLNSKCRAHLLQVSPQLYKLVKRQDQVGLDRAYGSERMVRRPAGVMTTANPEVLVEISNFEDRILSTRLPD